jgi:hypothetical protein
MRRGLHEKPLTPALSRKRESEWLACLFPLGASLPLPSGKGLW